MGHLLHHHRHRLPRLRHRTRTRLCLPPAPVMCRLQPPQLVLRPLPHLLYPVPQPPASDSCRPHPRRCHPELEPRRRLPGILPACIQQCIRHPHHHTRHPIHRPAPLLRIHLQSRRTGPMLPLDASRCMERYHQFHHPHLSRCHKPHLYQPEEQQRRPRLAFGRNHQPLGNILWRSGIPKQSRHKCISRPSPLHPHRSRKRN